MIAPLMQASPRMGQRTAARAVRAHADVPPVLPISGSGRRQVGRQILFSTTQDAFQGFGVDGTIAFPTGDD